MSVCNKLLKISVAKHAKYTQSHLILVLLILVSSAGFYNYSRAETIQGSDNTRFKQAVTTWLNNNDEQSLPLLAELAMDGNIAARLFLSRIERTERVPSHFVSGLSQEKQQALFRSPQRQGAFNLTWLQVEENLGNPLAIALSRSGLSYVDLETIKTLRSYGEIQATDHLVRSASFHGDDEVRNKLLNGLAFDDLLPFVRNQIRPEKKYGYGLQALKKISATTTPFSVHLDDLQPHDKEAVLYLALGNPYGELSEVNPWRAPIENWLQNYAAVKPIHNICSQQCPHEVNSCAVGVFGLTGGYYEAIKLKTPLESIVTQSAYLNSNRAQQQTIRHAALRRAEDGGELVTLADLSKTSQCLADLVSAIRTSVK